METKFLNWLVPDEIQADSGRRHGRLHSPRTERMTEKSPVTPIEISVQTQKKTPLELAMLPPTRPLPLMWTRGITDARSDQRRMMMYPERRPASTSVAYSQMTAISTAIMFLNPHGSIQRTM